jgi:hypothetical protein
MNAERMENYVDNFESMWRKSYPGGRDGNNMDLFIWDYLSSAWRGMDPDVGGSEDTGENVNAEEPDKDSSIRILIDGTPADMEEMAFVSRLLLEMFEMFCGETMGGDNGDPKKCRSCPENVRRVKLII